MNRRTFLAQAAMASLAARRCFATTTSIEVQTPLGKLRGEETADAHVFRGVPFAQPPVGTLRFRSSQPPAPWSGVRDAIKFAPAAMQPGGAPGTHSEDCLYLNIWAPKTPGPHPVLVWVHGGGFTGGRSSDPMFDGSVFARDGILCITVAYRLGVFGFVDWSPMLGDEYAGSANNGLLDVIAALKWVQGNIRAFGGDPQKVTVGGESAGAKLTDLLLGTPMAQPLFHQAISESGGAERIWSKAQALEIGAGWRDTWITQTSSPPLAALSADADQLIRLQQQFEREWPAHFPLRPEIDGVLISQSPIDSIRSGSSRGKRLLLGTNLDESSFFIGPNPEQDPTARDLGNVSLQQFQKIEPKYAGLYSELKEPLLRVRSLTAEEYWIPSLRVADALAEGGGEVFFYRLDFPAEGGRFAGLAYHSYDLRFVWDHFNETPSDESRSLEAAIHDAWCSFIKGARPAAQGLPLWPNYAPKERKTMLLNTKSEVQSQPHIKEFKLWDGLISH